MTSNDVSGKFVSNYISNSLMVNDKINIFNLPNGMQMICMHGEKPNIFLPKIKYVNIIVSNKVVEVTFSDGTKEKAVCKEPDIFSLEIAISICISKKIMGGSSAYNNAIKQGMKVYNDKLEMESAVKAEWERIEKKRAKRIAYKKLRDSRRKEEEERRKAREREEQIEIQKEAYLRAMNEMKEKNMDN